MTKKKKKTRTLTLTLPWCLSENRDNVTALMTEEYFSQLVSEEYQAEKMVKRLRHSFH